MNDVSDKLKVFLDYVAGKPSDDEYVQKLEAAVKKAKANKEWRREYMTAQMRDLVNQEIGEKRGEKRGEQTAMQLTSYLIQNGRSDDVIRAAEDKDFFDKLLAELMPYRLQQ